MADDPKTLEERVAALEAQAARTDPKGGKQQGRAEAERRFGKRDTAA